MITRRPARKLTIGPLDALDERIVPASGGLVPAATAAQVAILEARGGQSLGAIYQAFVNYEKSGGTGAFAPSQASRFDIVGTSVGVDIRLASGTSNATISQLQALGLKVTGTQNLTVEGTLPIGELPAAASTPGVIGLSPIAHPVTRATPGPVSAQVTAQTAVVTAKGGQELGSIYRQFASTGTIAASEPSRIYFYGNAVGLSVRVSSGNYFQVASQLHALGMKFTAGSLQNGTIEGFLPIRQLATAAINGNILSLSPLFKPIPR